MVQEELFVAKEKKVPRRTQTRLLRKAIGLKTGTKVSDKPNHSIGAPRFSGFVRQKFHQPQQNTDNFKPPQAVYSRWKKPDDALTNSKAIVGDGSSSATIPKPKKRRPRKPKEAKATEKPIPIPTNVNSTI